MSTYKPTEHDGLKADGTPDKRVGTGEFAGGKVDPVEAGKKGGQTSGTTDSDSTDNSGGSSGGSSGGQFAHGKVDPVEAGKQGGRSSGGDADYEDDGSDATGGDYKPTENGGKRQDGQPDGRVKQ